MAGIDRLLTGIKRAAGGALLTLVLLGAASAAPAGKPQVIAGVFALADEKPHSTATLQAFPLGHNTEGLDFSFATPSGPITRFGDAHGKSLHVIAISDDFRLFRHAHVDQAAANGHLRLRMAFPRAGHYHIYADATPTGPGHQVFRFDLPVGEAGDAKPVELKPTGLEAQKDSYSVRIDPMTISAGQAAHLTLHIDHDGKPATDLQPFLGAAAHGIFIAADTLSYTHGHAMAPPAAVMAMTVTLPARGLYKFWLQFAAGGQDHTISFVLPVS